MVSAETLLIPSFSVMFFRCEMTVVRLMLSLSAISLLMNPCAKSASTSTSLDQLILWDVDIKAVELRQQGLMVCLRGEHDGFVFPFEKELPVGEQHVEFHEEMYKSLRVVFTQLLHRRVCHDLDSAHDTLQELSQPDDGEGVGTYYGELRSIPVGFHSTILHSAE